jgi:hypothetical protein
MGPKRRENQKRWAWLCRNGRGVTRTAKALQVTAAMVGCEVGVCGECGECVWKWRLADNRETTYTSELRDDRRA